MKPIIEAIQAVKDRDEIGELLNQYGLTGDAAEVGVAFGGHARGILHHWKGQRLYLVDMWENQPETVYKEKHDMIDFIGQYQDCLKLAKEDPRVFIFRGPSVEVAKQLPDNSLDWVYIDANHCFEAVYADLTAWYPKVKKGGILSGHDYGSDSISWPHWCEVKRAVDQWMAEHNLTFTHSPDSSWWHVKS